MKKSSAATGPVKGRELILLIELYNSQTFEVYFRFYDPEQAVKDSVLIVDYNYTPWPRYGGNLLWR